MHESLQQDNAPAHTSIRTDFVLGKMSSLHWKLGLQSPMISTLSKVLWSVLKKNFCKGHSETLEGLLNYAQDKIERLAVEYIVKLYDSIPQRLQFVVAKKGYPTKYYFPLRNGMFCIFLDTFYYIFGLISQQ